VHSPESYPSSVLHGLVWVAPPDMEKRDSSWSGRSGSQGGQLGYPVRYGQDGEGILTFFPFAPGGAPEGPTLVGFHTGGSGPADPGANAVVQETYPASVLKDHS